MENRFDDLTKALAEGIPRRQALRRLAGLFGGALLGSLAFGGVARAAPKLCCTYSCLGSPVIPPYTLFLCVDGTCPPPPGSSCTFGGSTPVGDCKKCR
jgi:hypothetical protein